MQKEIVLLEVLLGKKRGVGGRETVVPCNSVDILSFRNYMNDSLRTDVFVRFQPESIACACIYLAARTLEVSVQFY